MRLIPNLTLIAGDACFTFSESLFRSHLWFGLTKFWKILLGYRLTFLPSLSTASSNILILRIRVPFGGLKLYHVDQESSWLHSLLVTSIVALILHLVFKGTHHGSPALREKTFSSRCRSFWSPWHDDATSCASFAQDEAPEGQGHKMPMLPKGCLFGLSCSNGWPKWNHQFYNRWLIKVLC